MKLARTGLIAAAILAVSTAAFAQRPDFSGTWTVDTSAMPTPPAAAPATPPAGATPPARAAPGAPAGRGGGRGMAMAGPMTVTQTATTLTVERTRGENKVVSVYKLDGTESVNKMMGRGGEMEVKSTVKWDGPKLVITTQQPGQDGAMMTSSQSWWLEGGNLITEGTRTGRDGNPMTTKTVYKKTT